MPPESSHTRPAQWRQRRHGRDYDKTDDLAGPAPNESQEEIETDGSMWEFKEFTDYLNDIQTDRSSELVRLYQRALDLGNTDNLEDDFTILEVAFG